jgi:acetyltransferase-like isoleucine patch superfamily enzyme
MRMFDAAADIAKVVLGRFRLSRYDDFTIADYFRGQGAQIGDDCRILIRSLGSEPYLIRIGNHCTIAGNVAFMTHDGGAWVFTEELPSLQKFGAIEIFDNCFIGFGAILMPNVRIGPNSIVGAGAVVTKNVSPNTIVAGCPAKPICTLEEYKRKVLVAWQRQKPPGYLSELSDGVRYAPVHIQEQKVRSSALLRKHLQQQFWGATPHHDLRADQAAQIPPAPSSPSATTLQRGRNHTALTGADDADGNWPSK